MSKLTEKQKRFVDNYMIDLNATKAYKAAYPNVKSDNSAAAASVVLLRNHKVIEYVAQCQTRLQEITHITQEKVLLELARVAFSNGTDFARVITGTKKKEKWNAELQDYETIDVEQQFVELHDTSTLSADKKAAISCIKETKYGISVESCDKVKALELIGKHLGMFKDKIELSGTITSPFEGLTLEELKRLAYSSE